MYLIDTNIFLEVMLAQARKNECKTLLKALETGKEKAVVTDFSLYSIMLIMFNLSKIKGLKVFLSSLSAYKGVTIYHTRLSDMIKATEMSEKGLDMDDSIQYSAALALNAKAIISFDKHFDGLEIPRAEPSQIVSA